MAKSEIQKAIAVIDGKIQRLQEMKKDLLAVQAEIPKRSKKRAAPATAVQDMKLRPA
jgi:hypothetical protein